jgi:hypothetical protein
MGRYRLEVVSRVRTRAAAQVAGGAVHLENGTVECGYPSAVDLQASGDYMHRHI